MLKIAKTTVVLAASIALSLSTLPAHAELLGETITEPQSAVFESQATLVASSRFMNTAEEAKVVAPKTEAEATLSIAAFDDKADQAKDKSVAAYEKAASYLSMAQESTDVAVKGKYTTAADTYEKTGYFYSVAADLYLTAQQKTAALSAKLPDAKTAEDNAGNLKVKTLTDAKLALTEAKAEVATQKNASELSADASRSQTELGTTVGLTAAATNVSKLAVDVAAKREAITELIADYQAKANSLPAGTTKSTYLDVVKTYGSALALTDVVVLNTESAASKFANAVPENPVNPGEQLKWHMFQADPDTALAVMKYNFAQLSFAPIRWEALAQSIAQDPTPYLDPANHQETITEYINGFRSSSLQGAAEAKDLLALVARYNDQIPTASDADAETWKQVSSYLVDIISIYNEMSQSQYQIYTTLSEASSKAPLKASLVDQSTEVKSVLKTGEKVVATAGEVDAKVLYGATEVTVFTTTPAEKVTITFTKTGAKTVTATDVSDQSGIAELKITKDYSGYTATVTVDGKVIDKEKVTKP